MKTVTEALEAIYRATDCSNEVFEALSARRNRFLAEAVTLGLARTIHCVDCDGDGGAKEPWREGIGYQLTLAGYRALTAFDPEGYPEIERRTDLLAEQAMAEFVADPLDPAERIPLSPEERARAGAAIERFWERAGR